MSPASQVYIPPKIRRPNEIKKIGPDLYEMVLSQGRTTVFDATEAELEILSAFRWCASRIGNAVYCVSRGINPSTGKVHVFTLNWFLIHNGDPELVTDHRDNDTLNNRRSNLRVLSRGDNVRRNLKTRSPSRSTSRFRGVCRTKHGTYAAQIQAYGHRRHLGTFKTEHEAALAWNKAASELFPAELAVNLNNVSEGVSA